MTSTIKRVERSIRDAIAFAKARYGNGAPHIRLGKLGEDLAVNVLREAGFTIIERNKRVLRREVDIIAWEGDALVFVEVKTRKSRAFGAPSEALTESRRDRLRKAASLYCFRHHIVKTPIRFDVVTVEFSDQIRPDIEIIKNAF